VSQLKAHEETIDGKLFVVYKLPPLDAQDLLIDILQALGPALGTVAGGLGTTKGDDTPITEREIDPAMLAGGVGEFVRALDKATMRAMIKTLAEVSTVDGQKLPSAMAIVFRADISLMYRWLWFALGVQFTPFFDLIRNSPAGGLLGNLATAGRSPDTSSGDGS